EQQKVKSLFLAAVEKATPAERDAFLDEACAGNAALRQRVEALLRTHDVPSDLLERCARELRAEDGPGTSGDRSSWPEPETDVPAGADVLGTRLGPYQLLQQLGEGGMGTVYLAAQEAPVRRQVALKVIKPGTDTAQILARFEAERQALALMDHPHIAKGFDAGTAADGRPYFVMELVQGVQLTTFCDQARLTPRERLELFVPVCQAVQHAHQKGIIHRDLKPSNVLVAVHDGRPVPKVNDFGLAKASG